MVSLCHEALLLFDFAECILLLFSREIFGGERSELPFLLFKLVCPVCFKCWKVSCTALQWLLANGQWAGGISNWKRLRVTPRSVVLCWSYAVDDVRNLTCFDANDFTCAAASARHLQKGPPHPRSLLDLLAEKHWLVGLLDSWPLSAPCSSTAGHIPDFQLGETRVCFYVQTFRVQFKRNSLCSWHAPSFPQSLAFGLTSRIFTDLLWECRQTHWVPVMACITVFMFL